MWGGAGSCGAVATRPLPAGPEMPDSAFSVSFGGKGLRRGAKGVPATVTGPSHAVVKGGPTWVQLGRNRYEARRSGNLQGLFSRGSAAARRGQLTEAV